MIKKTKFAVMVALVWLGTAMQTLAASLTVSPAAFDGFSRIEFQWEYPTQYRVSKSEGRVTVAFSREIDADVALIRRRLPDSVRSVAVGRDGRTLSLVFSRPFLIRDFGNENTLTLDLLGTDDPKTPVPERQHASSPVSGAGRSVRPSPIAADQSAPVARTASLAPFAAVLPQPVSSRAHLPASDKDKPVSLFAVQRANADQIVFSWRERTPFSQETKNGVYQISFRTDIPADSIDLTQIVSVLPPDLQKWDVSSGNGRLSVSVALPDGYQADAGERGTRVYLNLTPVKGRKIEAAARRPVTTGRPSSAGAAGKPSSGMKTSKGKATVKNVSPPVPPASEKKPEPPEEPAEKPIEPLPYSDDQDTVRLVQVSDPHGFSSEDETALPAFGESGWRSVTLSFSWPRLTGAAAFRRDGYLWIVFDRKNTFDFDTELMLNKDIIHEMVQIPHSHATILRFVTAEGYNPVFRREGLLWIVDLMYKPLLPQQNADLLLQRRTPFGPRIFIPLEQMPHVIPLIDPEVGDLMYIVPVYETGKGVAHSRSFVDASFPATAQGVVVIPNSEGVNVYPSTSGVEIRGPKGGMRFSPEEALSYLARSSVQKDPLAQLLDVGVWGGDDPAAYNANLKKLRHEVSEASKNEKPLKRLALARFYFANGMYPETLGTLRSLIFDAPSFEREPAVLALRGAANFMMMRYDEAMKDFASPLIGKDGAVDFWRGATLAATSPTPEKYLAPMKNNMGILQNCPPVIKTRLALAGLHAAVSGGDGFAVQNFIEAAYNPLNSASEDAEIAFYHALWQENSGMYNQAVKEMSLLASGKDYYFRAMGSLEKIRMQTRLNQISPEERIAELEKLMYAWRGDAFEYNLMTMLVAAYQDQKEYAKVLRLLKNMQIRFRDMPESKQIRPLMSRIFEHIYLDDDGNRLSPVKAVALYNEFGELTPEGEKGAKIVRRLADRLVAIDLLEPAAGLLERETGKRIAAKEKGIIFTRLALIRLLNKEPEKALKALSDSEKTPFSDKVAAQRKYIKAKALADGGKTDEAGKVLEDDDSAEAKALRAEIYWQAKDWGKAADAMRHLVAKPVPGQPLTPQEAQRVLDWAAALRLAGRSKVVMRLRENFLPYMQKTALAQPFDFITQSPKKGLLDYHSVAKEIESAENFHSFAKDYVDILKTQGLSQAVR